jgi:hypothetical protein
MNDTPERTRTGDWHYPEAEDELQITIYGEIHLFACIELLRYCDDSGEGTLALSQRFLDESNLFKADVLQDWINGLTYEYNKVLEEGL